MLVAGTTGEGVLLTLDERRRLTERFVAARPEGFQIAVHAGAQTTHDTVALAAHALRARRRRGRGDRAAVLPARRRRAVRALRSPRPTPCDPLPFYVYEFAGRSGYAIPVEVIERLRDEAPNLAGLKVSDLPFDAVKPYLLDGLDVFIGQEPLVLEGLAAGAVGCVSGLASAWPEVVATLVHDRDPEAHARVIALRDGLEGIPFHRRAQARAGPTAGC